MKSALIVFGSALIYAGMYKGAYGLPIFDAKVETPYGRSADVHPSRDTRLAS
jgi:hypothetical protein